MSATLDVEPIARFLDDCPIVRCSGAAPSADDRVRARRVRRATLSPRSSRAPAGSCSASCLVRGEIERARADLMPLASNALEVVPLHGSLAAAAQDEAIQRARPRAASSSRRTSPRRRSPFPGVSAVIDTGLRQDSALRRRTRRRQPVARADHRRIQPTSARAAPPGSDQGSCGGSGIAATGCVRIGEPEITRVDLAGPLLDLLGWGADPESFEWFEAPPQIRIDGGASVVATAGRDRQHRHRATRHLARTPAAADSTPPAAGAHPRRRPRRSRDRRARALCWPSRSRSNRAASRRRAICCRRSIASTRSRTTRGRSPRSCARIAAAALDGDIAPSASEEALRHALFTAYADRLARRRSGTIDRLTLATGHGAALARESGVRDGEYPRGPRCRRRRDVMASPSSRIRAASRVEPEWIAPTSVTSEHRLDRETRPRAGMRALPGTTNSCSKKRPHRRIPRSRPRLLRDAWLAREPDPRDCPTPAAAPVRRPRRGCCRTGPVAATAPRPLDEIELRAISRFEATRALARLAPESIVVPSGRRRALEYRGRRLGVRLGQAAGAVRPRRVAARRARAACP